MLCYVTVGGCFRGRNEEERRGDTVAARGKELPDKLLVAGKVEYMKGMLRVCSWVMGRYVGSLKPYRHLWSVT